MRPRHDANFTFTKVVATLGPATEHDEDLDRLLDTGVDVCRLNFSHGNHAGHLRNLQRIRAWEQEHGRPVAVLGDLCGPKIRLTEVAGEAFQLSAGDEVRILRGDKPTTRAAFHVTYGELIDEVRLGSRIYIDDGLIRLLVIDTDDDTLTCTCTVGGTIRSRKGVNLPDTALSVPALTEKDREDLQWALENALEFVALSFVRRPEDLRELRRLIDERISPLKIIAKIEKAEALQHLDVLIAEADGVMVARGDLGVEMDVWRVPLVQKDITRRCRDAAKPVIIATQMLQSMVESAMPTRAEVSDVANAILDSADAVMLSAESAAGRFPIAAAEIMNLVAQSTEQYQRGLPHSLAPDTHCRHVDRRYLAIAGAAAQAALRLDAKLVAVWTATGHTVRLISRHRLPMPIVGLTYTDCVCRQLCLLHGVIPLRIQPRSTLTEWTRVLDRRLLDLNLVTPGDLIMVVTATNPTAPGSTDTTLIHRIQNRSE